MANTGLTYGQIIAAAELQALNNPTAPVSGDQDYQILGNLIANLAIPEWENQRGVLWQELWVPEPNYGTIQAQTNGPQTWSLPVDYKFIGDGFIWVTYPGSTSGAPAVRSFPVKKIEELSLNSLQNQPCFYIYGNPVVGYTLQSGWVPQSGAAEIGANISFRYYKHANIPTFDSAGNLIDPNDTPEMSNPSFIIYKIAAQLSAVNYNMNMYQILEAKANDALKQMVAGNEMPSNFQDDYVKDIDGLTGMGPRIPNRYSSTYWTYGVQG